MLDDDMVDITGVKRCVGDGDSRMGRLSRFGNERVGTTGVNGGDGGKGMDKIRRSSGDRGRPCSSSEKIGEAQIRRVEARNECGPSLSQGS